MPSTALRKWKGGKRFGFAALVVVGDAKAASATAAASQGSERRRQEGRKTQKHMIRIALREAAPCILMLRPLRCGQGHDAHGVPRTGIIAGGPMRAVLKAWALPTSSPSPSAPPTRITW